MKGGWDRLLRARRNGPDPRRGLTDAHRRGAPKGRLRDTFDYSGGGYVNRFFAGLQLHYATKKSEED